MRSWAGGDSGVAPAGVGRGGGVVRGRTEVGKEMVEVVSERE